MNEGGQIINCFFVADMFSSSLEVAKFEGAKIKAVSGIRGQIKKAVSKPEGCFRATFEDKIQLSGTTADFTFNFIPFIYFSFFYVF